jgi:hypothetical protein
MENNLRHLENWVFSYNSHTDNFRAVTRDQWLDVYNLPEENFLRSKEFTTLRDIIIKNEGDPEKIKQLIKNK